MTAVASTDDGLARSSDPGGDGSGPGGVRLALARLRPIGSVARLLEAAPEALCRSCGFDRAALFRVTGSRIVAVSAHSTGESTWGHELVATTRARPLELGQSLVEGEMVRRRQAIVVEDAPSHPRTIKALVVAAGLGSYVAAPIVAQGRVAGFFHADCHGSGRPLGLRERDTLWAFAEGFAYAFERLIFLERLRAQRDQVRTTTAALDVYVSELTHSDIELVAGEPGRSGPSRRGVVSLAPESGIEELLTRREREVLASMAHGTSNGAIAVELVISEATVKSHVKSILRKLGAANRAEAVSRYLLALRSGSGRVVGRRSYDPGQRGGLSPAGRRR